MRNVKSAGSLPGDYGAGTNDADYTDYYGVLIDTSYIARCSDRELLLWTGSAF